MTCITIEFLSNERAPLDIAQKIREVMDYEVRQNGVTEYGMTISPNIGAVATIIVYREEKKEAVE